jgi:hypothetical protein
MNSMHPSTTRTGPARADADDTPTIRGRGTSGQATTEYALILLGAAVVGLIVVAWATSGGASGRIGQLFNSVVDSIISRL